jgi:hypothetical protein
MPQLVILRHQVAHRMPSGAFWRTEEQMPLRKTSSSGRSFMLPLLWVFFLIALYWLLTEWQMLPGILAAAKAGLFR